MDVSRCRHILYAYIWKRPSATLQKVVYMISIINFWFPPMISNLGNLAL